MKFFNNGCGGGGNFFYKYLLMKHKKLNISTTVHLTRSLYILVDIYKVVILKKKIGQGGGPFKNAEGGSLKLIMSNLNLQTPNFHKALYRQWESKVDTFK